LTERLARATAVAAACAALSACAAVAPPIGEAAARASAQAAFADAVADWSWDAAAFGQATAARSDVGWTVAYPCRAAAGGPLVVTVGLDGRAGYSLAPAATCRQRPAPTSGAPL